MKLVNYYSKKSKYKKWGDFLLVMCPALTGVALQLPLSDNAIKWILAGLNVGTILGKFLLNKYDAKGTELNK